MHIQYNEEIYKNSVPWLILAIKQHLLQTKQQQKLNFFKHNIELKPISSAILCANNICAAVEPCTFI